MLPSLAGARRQARQGSSIPTSRTDRARAAISAAVEPLEGRMLLSASDILGLASGGQDAKDPSADLVDAVLASTSHAVKAPTASPTVTPAAVRASRGAGHGHGAPTRPKLPAHADPLSPIGDPAPTDKAGKGGTATGGGGPVTTTAVDDNHWNVNASVDGGTDVSEFTHDTPGSFHFSAGLYGCCSAYPAPSTVTISYTLTGTATAGIDYDGPLLNQYVTIPLCGASGQVDVPYSAIDDEIDEPEEKVDLTITGVCTDSTADTNVLTAFAETAVKSNDYTITDDWDPGTHLSRNGNGNFQKEKTVTLTMKKGGVVQKDVPFTVKIVDPATKQEVDWLQKTVLTTGGKTDADGQVQIRLTAGGGSGQKTAEVRIEFTVSDRDADKQPVHTVSVIVVD